MRTNKQHILDEVDDHVSRFLYYDRKEDDDLPLGAIDDAVKNGDLSFEELVEAFSSALWKGLKK